MIEASGIGYRVRDRALLEQVDLEIRPGEVTAVVGANGAGKSTLLRILSGELEPAEGEVRLDGRSIRGIPVSELALRRAVMPQSCSLAFPFRAAEVVLLGRTPHVRRREAERDRLAVQGALQHAGVDHLSDRRYPTLSGGERQRVDFARALAQVWEPSASGARYLLLDEPTASLDLARQHDLLGAVRRFAEQGVGVLVVIHDLNLAARYADELLVLKAGRVVSRGTPWQVLTPEGIREAFGLPVVVTHHPCHDCPLVVADPAAHVGTPTHPEPPGPTPTRRLIPVESILPTHRGDAHELAGHRTV